MARLEEIVEYCQRRLRVSEVRDHEGAFNGLQVENDGTVTRIGAVVDAGLVPFREAAARGVDLLICHHGMLKGAQQPIVGPVRDKLETLLRGNIALYSCHLPLDAHQELGNNAVIARTLGLEVERWGIVENGTPFAPVCRFGGSRADLRAMLQRLFPRTVELPFGGAAPSRVCILSGSGSSALPALRGEGVDTIVTGELRQASFNLAQELGLNVYACGHYDTEVFGVRALAAELAERFDLPWEFIPSGCPL
jgi:dinuclear metal center YbgI/SA1388 family protein